MSMALEEVEDYDKLRAAVLRRYHLDGETYRERFRSSAKRSEESYAEWSVRLRVYLGRWVREAEVDEFQGLMDLIMREQLLSATPPELRVWLKERDPQSVGQLTRLADIYILSRKRP